MQNNEVLDLQGEYEDLLIEFETQVATYHYFCSSIDKKMFFCSIMLFISCRELSVRYKLIAWQGSLRRLICFLLKYAMTTPHLVSIRVQLMGTRMSVQESQRLSLWLSDFKNMLSSHSISIYFCSYIYICNHFNTYAGNNKYLVNAVFIIFVVGLTYMFYYLFSICRLRC